MPLKSGQGRKKNRFKQYEAIIPTKREPKRPLRPKPTEYSPKGIRVTAIATSGRKIRPK